MNAQSPSSPFAKSSSSLGLGKEWRERVRSRAADGTQQVSIITTRTPIKGPPFYKVTLLAGKPKRIDQPTERRLSVDSRGRVLDRLKIGVFQSLA